MTENLLDRIDATVAGWEAAPESWLPGDPLYERPYGEPEQTVRPMFEVLLCVPWDGGRCKPCGVSWEGPEPCWCCGTERPLPEVPWGAPEVVRFDIEVNVQPFVDALRAAAGFEQAMRRVRRQMRNLGADR